MFVRNGCNVKVAFSSPEQVSASHSPALTGAIKLKLCALGTKKPLAGYLLWLHIQSTPCKMFRQRTIEKIKICTLKFQFPSEGRRNVTLEWMVGSDSPSSLTASLCIHHSPCGEKFQASHTQVVQLRHLCAQYIPTGPQLGPQAANIPGTTSPNPAACSVITRWLYAPSWSFRCEDMSRLA